jgi:hypothetical protein
MKYLKKFESSEEIDFGVTPEDIKYLFTDISDIGWQVDVKFLRRLFGAKPDKPIFKEFNLIPYIEVTISKPTQIEQRFSRSKWKEVQELKSFIESDEFREIIEVASLRLDDLDLYIQRQSNHPLATPFGFTSNLEDKYTFNILIYRKTDKSYIK